MLSLENILLIVLIVILILAIIILIVVLIKRKSNHKELFTGLNVTTNYQNTLKDFVKSWVETVNNTFNIKESFVQPRQTYRPALRKKEDYEKPRTGRSFKNLLV